MVTEPLQVPLRAVPADRSVDPGYKTASGPVNQKLTELVPERLSVTEKLALMAWSALVVSMVAGLRLKETSWGAAVSAVVLITVMEEGKPASTRFLVLKLTDGLPSLVWMASSQVPAPAWAGMVKVTLKVPEDTVPAMNPVVWLLSVESVNPADTAVA